MNLRLLLATLSVALLAGCGTSTSTTDPDPRGTAEDQHGDSLVAFLEGEGPKYVSKVVSIGDAKRVEFWTSCEEANGVDVEVEPVGLTEEEMALLPAQLLDDGVTTCDDGLDAYVSTGTKVSGWDVEQVKVTVKPRGSRAGDASSAEDAFGDAPEGTRWRVSVLAIP